MLKKRIAATLVIKNGLVVQSKNFKEYLPVGKPAIAIEYLNQWGIDEIILLDISRTANNEPPDYEMIKAASRHCYVPLTVAGGINNISQVKMLMNCGVDKIALNQSALHNPGFVTEIAHLFGDQCVVVSIDAVKTGEGYRLYDYIKGEATGIEPGAFAKEMQQKGAGEILINSVDSDGTYTGFDMELINEVCSNVTIPVIGAGGAKNAADFIKVFQSTNVSAATAANFFHFTEHSVNITKAAVLKEVPIRLDTHADYSINTVDTDYRLLKRTDKELEEMLYVIIDKEVI